MTRLSTKYVSTLPVLLVLAGCGNDLESRNAALGFEDDGTSDVVFTRQTPRSSGSPRQIDGLGNVDQVSDDFAIMDGPEAGPETAGVEGDDDDGPTIIDASPDDLRDLAQGFAPDPVDDASGIDPSPMLSDPVGD